jgi:hypothetical protein
MPREQRGFAQPVQSRPPRGADWMIRNAVTSRNNGECIAENLVEGGYKYLIASDARGPNNSPTVPVAHPLGVPSRGTK